MKNTMKSYLFKEIQGRFIALSPLDLIFDDSDSDNERVRSTDLELQDNQCLELVNDAIIVVEKTQEIINGYNLPNLKIEKLQALKGDFNASKKITIQNGNTLIIKHNTPERNIFLDKLTNVLQESLSKDVSLSYQQQVDNVMYRFSALPIIWSYIFKDLFLVENKNTNGSLTGFKQNIREYNRITFEVISLKIQNTTTTEELNAISWEFANPNGIFINVNEKAEQMLNDPTVDDFTKSAINQSKDPETGQIHLINIVG